MMAFWMKLWLVVLLFGESWSFSLDLRESDITPIVIRGNISQAYSVLVNASVEYLFEISEPEIVTDSRPACVIVECSEATRSHPVLVVVRQAKGVLSWQLPFMVPTRSDRVTYYRTSRILCPNHNYKNVFRSKGSQSSGAVITGADHDVYISISSASTENLNVSLSVNVQEDFIVSINETRLLHVTPSEPRYYEFHWPEESSVKSVLLRVDSDDEICMAVSIQNITCPVFDLERTVQFEGLRQTVDRRGGITLTKPLFPDGFYVVFVVKGDDVECGKSSSSFNRSKTVTFSFTQSIGYEDYVLASVLTLLVYITVYAFSIIVAVAYFFKQRMNPDHFDDLNVESLSQVDYGIASASSKQSPIVSAPCDCDDDSSLDELDIDMLSDIETDKNVVRSKSILYLCDLARKNPRILRKKSLLYFWNLLTVATFYVLPVVQLVISYQLNLLQTGNQDLCYYNFLCSHPLGFLSDFNHVFSNVGYLALGLLFVILVYRRDLMHSNAAATQNSLDELYGIPQHYGLFYAMGAALMMEGILSGCYHVCPNHSNFQFDTSFMYVIAMLCMLKIYHTRHPDVNASACATFGMLALVILVGMMGILSGTYSFWIGFTFLHLTICLWLSGKIYYMGRLRFGFSLFRRIYHAFCIEFLPDPCRFLKPKYPSRLVLLILGNAFNWVLAALVWIYHLENSFGTYLLAIFMVNLLLYTVFYIVMKLCCKEKILFQPTVHIFLTCVSWAASFYFFFRKSTSWAVTPAESRRYNHACELMDFYDKHDIWHFLSAFSMFFSFMVLLTLDDDLVQVPRERILVF